MKNLLKLGLSISMLVSATTSINNAAAAQGDSTISGTVMAAGQALPDSSVTLWRAGESDTATAIQTLQTDAQGRFTFEDAPGSADAHTSYYITAQKAQLGLLSVLGDSWSGPLVVNELTTVASVFTHAQFINGTTISGPARGLQIAAGNVHNFANLQTGNWGDVIVDANNSTESTTLARTNTLANLISLCATPEKAAACTRFVTMLAPEGATTLDAVVSIARQPWQHSSELFELFAESYPAPVTANPEQRRTDVTYLPYLSYAPEDFALSLRFTGGGTYAPGRITFDADGNMWSGQNWMPGSQSGAINGIGGNLVKMAPDGKALSPDILGFTGMGIDGVGWGTAVSNDRVWLSSFNSRIGVFDFDGNPVGPEGGITLDGQIGQGQGVAVAPNGDVWVADATRDQMQFFPNGDPGAGRIVKVKGLHSPFGVVVDNQLRVWVTNSRGDNVTVFPSDNPEQARQIFVGLGVRGIALDSKGNAWVASNMGREFPRPEFPKGEVSIMKSFYIAYSNLLKNADKMPTGLVSLIKPDGTQDDPQGYVGQNHEINVPWGVTVDGNDNVWVANFQGENVSYMCGADVTKCPPGTQTGDVIHSYTSSVSTMLTDAGIDSAGNVWTANNWNVGETVVSDNPNRKLSTNGGGNGIVVFYGLAKPVKTPLIGQVRPL